NRGLDAPLYYYRDSGGNEVNLIIQQGSKLMPIEIKSAQSFHPSFLKNIRYLRNTSVTFSQASIVYAGDLEWEKENTTIIPYYKLNTSAMT
ncbi:MAG TPA: AAA family ATPase, partial [Candidatus Cloacimonadota bacterium]|nr:AAA family ATPase [Candidatus Cloacimonadota bacterium]